MPSVDLYGARKTRVNARPTSPRKRGTERGEKRGEPGCKRRTNGYGEGRNRVNTENKLN